MTCSQPLPNGYEFKFSLGFNVCLQEKKVCMIKRAKNVTKVNKQLTLFKKVQKPNPN
jgi:hypothetical protein